MCKRFLGLALTGLVLLAAAPAADSAPQTASGFTVFPSPTIANGGYLTGVAAASASDVWAIGHHWGGTRFVEHYNGSTWRVTASPPLPHAELNAISAHGSAVWVAGACLVDTGHYGCVARYTGSRWVRVAIPRQFSYGFDFSALLVFSDTNVLVAGAQGSSSKMIRWNGKTWSRVEDVPYRGGIQGIAGTLSTRLFSVGVAGGPEHGVFERELPSGLWQALDPFPAHTEPSAIAASSAENVWVVGAAFDPRTDVWNPLAMRWNGTTATVVNVPSDPSGGFLNGVVTIQPDNTWAVGGGLIEHYTGGSSFTEMTSSVASLQAITAVPGSDSDLWAVGAGAGQPIILHHS